MKAKSIKVGDVWFAEFPLEEDPSEITERPVIILDAGDGDQYGPMTLITYLGCL